jgi:hypothetical protein
VIWIPPPPIGVALVASVSLPLFVLVLARGPWHIEAPMKRFIAAAVGAVLVMAIGLYFEGPTDWVELAAAIVLLLGSLLAGFTFWTLIAWGFTLSMLRVLEENRGFDSVEAWCGAYTGGQGIGGFASDRCGLLLRLGLVRHDEQGRLIATSTGRFAARFVTGVRYFFGLARR